MRWSGWRCCRRARRWSRPWTAGPFASCRPGRCSRSASAPIPPCWSASPRRTSTAWSAPSSAWTTPARRSTATSSGSLLLTAERSCGNRSMWVPGEDRSPGRLECPRMLGELHIRDLGVIDDARLQVAPGLNVLTGETGAGKTMVVDALALLLGERADPGAVRAGRAAALVEGRLATDDDGQVAAALAAAGAAEEEGEVVVARQVLAEGRSRAQLQGRMATVAAIAEVVRPLVEIHGQHEFQRLLRPAVQRELLDRFAGDKVLALRDEFASGWRRLRAVQRELDQLASRARDREREAELLRYQLEEIEAAAVRVGELEELDAESERLTNAEALREAAVLAWQFLEGDEDAGASTALAAAARTVSGPGRHDPSLGELAERASGLAAEVADLASSLRAYAEGVLADPQRLDAVQGRIAQLRDLLRKYGDDEAAVLVTAERAAQRLADVGGSLSARRAEAAAGLAAAVEAELRDLAMPSADLRMLVEQDEDAGGLEVSGRRLAAGDEGLDRVEIQLSANPGLPLRPLGKAASGGELSRVMLALRVVLAAADAVKAGGPRAGGAPGARDGRPPGAAGAGGASGPRAAVGGERS